MRAWISICAAMLLTLAGCAAPRADNDADRMGRTTIDAVQRNDWVVLDKVMGEAMMADPEHAPKMDKVRALFPTDPPWSIKLLSSTTSRTWRAPKDAPERATLNYLYAFAQQRMVIELVVEHHGFLRVYDPVPLKPGQVAAKPIEPKVEEVEPPKPEPGQRPFKVAKVYRLISIAAQPVDPAQVAANRFFGPPKTAAQVAFLIATFATPALMLAAAIAVLRARGLTRKPLWVLIAFVGLGAAWMNWTTGAYGAVPAINLVGFGLGKGPSPLSPWILRLVFPAGALVVAIRLWWHGRRKT